MSDALIRIEQGAGRREMARALAVAETASRYGLALTPAQIGGLMRSQEQALVDTGRIVLGEGILPELVWTFCDSPHIPPEEWADTLAELMRIFYHKKGESGERFSDEELLRLLRWHFDHCEGALDALRDVSPEELAAGPVWDPPYSLLEILEELER